MNVKHLISFELDHLGKKFIFQSTPDANFQEAISVCVELMMHFKNMEAKKFQEDAMKAAKVEQEAQAPVATPVTTDEIIAPEVVQTEQPAGGDHVG